MSSGETTWLDELEASVKQAAETIETLREEKVELARRIEELEAEAAGEAGSGEAAEAWREERKEIRKRVQKLTKRLEGLLEYS